LKSNTTDITDRPTSHFIMIRMIFSMFIIALKKYRSPLQAFKVLKQLNLRKKTIQGITGVPKLFKNGKRYFYELNQPGWPSLAFNRFFENEMNKTIPFDTTGHRLQNVVFAITKRCALKCRHCFEWDRLDTEEKLKFEDLQLILSQVQQLGASVIQISGGEPLERFEDACKLATQALNETDLWLLTSGFGLTFRKAAILKKSGYSGINVSVDHWNEDLHNKFRGNNESFTWAIKAAENADQAGLVLALSLCATREFTTKENLFEYLDLASKLNACFIQILEPRSIGRFSAVDVKLSSSQHKIIKEFYHEVNNKKRYRHLPTIIYHGSYQRTHGCLGAANRYFYSDSEGNVHACPFCQDSPGNILETPLENLLDQLEKSGCHLFKSYAD